MKKIIVIYILLLGSISFTSAQVSHGGIPWGYSNRAILTSEIPTYYSQPPTQDKIDEVIRNNSESKENYQFAISSELNLDIRENSRIDSLDEGILYRLSVVSSQASSIGIIFSKYNLPYGATLFLYNEYEIRGAYTSHNNSLSNKFPILPLKGDSLVIEYFEPYFFSTEKKELIIGKISHGILETDFPGTKVSSCEVNVNCPDGDNWQKEKRSVCKIVIGNSGVCTGTLLNNTKNDGTPYILTANHCISNQNEADESIFIFNYESSECDYLSNYQRQSISGGVLRASEHNTDFSLVELNRRIPSTYHPYFAGWDRLGGSSFSGVCIHHHRGKDKKISTNHNYPVTSDCINDMYNPSNFWIIKGWYHGIVGPGSSGAALFDAGHKVIGQLYGGCPKISGDCDNIEKNYANYGKFNVSWNYGNTPSKRLKEWLDPDQINCVILEPLESCDSNVSVNHSLHVFFSNNNDYYATDTIYSEQVISTGQSIEYTAGKEIILGNGFETEEGGSLDAQISTFNCVVSCPNICVEQWVDNAHVGGSIQYHVLNADHYYYEVYSQLGVLIHSSSGDITSDIVNVWNNINVTGNYLATIRFTSNCGENVSKTLILHISSSSKSHRNLEPREFSEETEDTDKIIQVFPNPASNYFSVFVKSTAPYTMHIFDNKGNMVTKWDYLNADFFNINTNGFHSGLYYITIVMGEKTFTKKIIIK